MADEDVFLTWVELNKTRFPGDRASFMFDDLEEDFDKLIEKYLNRKPLVDQMKKLQGKAIKAQDWMAPAAKMDYLSASERDLRMRFRRRVLHMQVGATHRAAVAESLTAMADNIAALTPSEENQES